MLTDTSEFKDTCIGRGTEQQWARRGKNIYIYIIIYIYIYLTYNNAHIIQTLANITAIMP